MRRSVGLAVVATAFVLEASCTHSTLDLYDGAGEAADWWDDAWAFRAPVDVVAGPAVVPSAYSVALTFDHAALVAAGHAAADGHDLRVVEAVLGVATELDRIPAEGNGWDSPATTIWFRTPTSIAAQGALRVWLYYGNPGAVAAPEDPSKVWSFSDDFESGDLSRWNLLVNDGNHWSSSTSQAHTGTRALQAGSLSGSRRVIVANGVDETDLALSAWWYTTASTSLDFSQAQRVDQTLPLNLYKANFYSADGWDVSKLIDSSYTQISPPLGGPIAPSTWVQVTTLVLGSSSRALVNGAQVSPASGWTNVGTELTHGSVGFQDFRVPSGTSVWVDDVVARRYVEPEPAASAGAEEAHP